MATDVGHVNPKVLGRQLRNARKALGLTLSEASELAGVTSRQLGSWEADRADPPLETLWRLSELYKRPTDYFLSAFPPRPSHIDFRVTVANGLEALSLETRQTIARFEELCRYQAELEEITNRRILVALPRGIGGSAEDMAETTRRALGIESRPIADLRSRIEEAGVRVFALPVGEISVAGLSWWHEEYGPCLLVNARDLPTRRNFSMAHELGHLVHGVQASICDLETDSAEEVLANSFAGALLIPAWDLSGWFQDHPLPETPSWQDFSKASRRYEVGPEALAIRAEELGLVAPGTVARLRRAELPAFHPRRGKIPAWRRQLGERYTQTALDAYSAGEISLSRLARYLGLNIRAATTAAEDHDVPARLS